MRRSRKCLGLIALMVICGDLLVDRVEAGGRNRCWNQRSYSCVTPSPACCAAQPTACQTTSPCNSSSNGCGVGSTFGTTYFCQSPPGGVAFVVGGVNYYSGKEYTSITANCSTSGTPATSVVESKVCPGAASCNTPGGCACERAFTATGQLKRFEKQQSHHIPVSGTDATVVGRTYGRIKCENRTRRLELIIVQYHHPIAPKIWSYAAVGGEIDCFPDNLTDNDVPEYSFEERMYMILVHAEVDYRVVLAP